MPGSAIEVEATMLFSHYHPVIVQDLRMMMENLYQGGLTGVRVAYKKESFFLKDKSTPVKYYAASVCQEPGKENLISGKAKKAGEVSFLEGLYIILSLVNMALAVVLIEYSYQERFIISFNEHLVNVVRRRFINYPGSSLINLFSPISCFGKAAVVVNGYLIIS